MSPVKRIIALVCFGLLLVGLTAGTARAEKRIALVIGNAAYQAGGRLANAVNDAEAIAAKLREINFDVTFEKELTNQQFLTVAAAFTERMRGADLTLFYYAGHAVQVLGTNYLLPIDVDKSLSDDNLAYRSFALQNLESNIRKQSRLGIILLDACRNNPFEEQLSAGTREFTRGMSVTRVPQATDDRGELAIVFATAANRLALDKRGSAEHSPFAQALLEYIAVPGLSLNEMLLKVKNRVKTLTGGGQKPSHEDNIASTVYLAGPPKPDPLTLEVSDWNAIQHSTNVEAFRSYLERYPTGAFRQLAQSRIEQLAAPNAAAPSPAAPPPPAPDTPLVRPAGEPPSRARPLHRRWELWLGVGTGAAAIVALGLGLGLSGVGRHVEQVEWK